MTNDNNIESKYVGTHPEQWEISIQSLQNVHTEVLPSCLVKGNQQQWISVREDFPEVDYDQESFKKGQDAIDFIETEIDLISLDEAVGTRDELTCISIYQSCKKFFEIMAIRIATRDKYLEVCNKTSLIRFCGMNITLKTAKHAYLDQVARKTIASELFESYERFIETKEEYEKSFLEFKTLVNSLEKIENRRNKNYFLNKEMLKTKLVEIEATITKEQSLWDEALKYLRDNSKPAKEETLGVDNKIQSEENVDKTKKLITIKMKHLQQASKEAEASLHTMNLRELESSLAEINKLTNELKYEDLSEKDSKFIEKNKTLVRDMGNKIDDYLKEREESKEQKRIELNSNIRSMDTIKLPELHGFSDFMDWRKGQKCLNTHPDGYKKAQALIDTLKNPDDKLRCKGISTWDRLMEILEEKYLHEEQLVPTLITKLKNLSEAKDHKTLDRNIQIMLNIYEQLCDISYFAISRFDLTIVEELIKKFPTSEQYKYDRRRLREIKNFKVVNEYKGKDEKEKAKKIDPEDDTIRNRQFFIDYILYLDKAFKATRARLAYTQPQITNKPYKKDKAHSTYVAEASAETKCLFCERDLHQNRFGKKTYSLGQCPKFKGLKLQERENAVKTFKACWICLCPGHGRENCKVTRTCGTCNNGQKHHPLICRKKTQETHCIACAPSNAGVLLNYSEGIILDKRESSKSTQSIITIFYDWGSTPNFVNLTTARRNNYLPIRYEHMTLMTFGHTERKRLPLYKIIMLDKLNNKHMIEAYGVPESIMKKYETGITDETVAYYAKLFKVKIKQINNPTPSPNGCVDVLLGMGNVSLFPKPYKLDNNTILSTSKFGRDYILAGRVDEKKPYEEPFPNPPSKIHSEEEILPFSPSDVSKFTNVPWPSEVYQIETQANYWTTDQLGLNMEPKCITCIKAPPCKDCTYLNQPQSIKEMSEGKMIQNSIKYDEKDNVLRVSYPYLKDPVVIFPPDKTNVNIATRMAYNLKRGLIRDKLMDQYTDSFLQMLDRGAIRELSKEEISKWESNGGPVNYCSHHAVLKDSKSTACRSVCNSSLAHAGTSLNNLLPKGPKAISNLLHVLMRFRSTPFTIVADLSKAYNTIKTSEMDCHLRRLLWWSKEDLETENAPLRTYGMTSVAFGDTPSAYYLECAKQLVSKKIQDEGSELLSQQLLRSSYVDDFAIPIENKDDIEVYKSKIEDGFSRYGFKVKEFITPGKEQGERLELLFGHVYDVCNDKIRLKFVVNFSNKKRSQKTEPPLKSSSNIDNLQMTKRKMMSLMASQYDPLGLGSIYLAKIKIFLSRIFKNQKYENWDEPFEGDEQKSALSIVKECVYASENPLEFNRANKPEGYKLKKLIVFCDASINALQVVCYGYYENKDGQVHTSLLCGKNKICCSTVPRNELQGLVAAHRLALNYIRAMDDSYFEDFEGIVFLSDSTCVLDFLNDSYQGKDIYIINRISEIYNTVRKMNITAKYYWIESKLNIADWGTKENTKYEYLNSKEWQEGPAFIKNLEKFAELKWTIKQENIPENIQEIYLTETMKEEYNNILTKLLGKYKSFRKILSIYAKIKWWRFYTSSKSKISCSEDKEILKRENYEETKRELYKLCKPNFDKIQGIKRQYYVEDSNEENVTLITRPFSCNNSIVQEKMILLDNCDLSRTILNDLHIHTSSVEREIAKMYNNGYYILNSRNYFKRLQTSCLMCRRIRKAIVNVPMGPSMAIDASKQYPFTHVFSDLKGPIYARLSRNQKQKCWILTTSDIFTRYTTYTLISSMTANAVLQGIKTAAYSIGGRLPKFLYTDWGTNYVPIQGIGASEDEDKQKLKVTELSNLLESANINLIISSPKAPWRQGGVECMHKIFIKAMKRANLTANSYDIVEWVHILQFMSYTVNLRPLSIKLNDSLLVLNPMKLVFGNAYTSEFGNPSQIGNIENNKLYRHLDELEKSLKIWKRIYVETFLVECKKAFHTKTKTMNLQKGDIVFILDYKNKTTGFPQIGIIAEVKSERTFLVKYVKKEAKLSPNNSNKIVKGALLGEFLRPAQGLSFICHSRDDEIIIEPTILDTDNIDINANDIQQNQGSKKVIVQSKEPINVIKDK